MSKRPRLLIEDWLPVTELGIESRRERAAASALPPLSFLHVWWARRPLAASAGAVLASVMPVWSQELAHAFSAAKELWTEEAYHDWFLWLCGIWGDPVAAKAATDAAVASGVRVKNPYTYKQAYKNSPSTHDLALLHDVLAWTWGELPTVIDPTAGGGSIPYTAIRYGLPTTANDLNPIPASLLRAGVEIPARYGTSLAQDIERIGSQLVERVRIRLERFFPSGTNELVATYLFARSVSCPRTGKPVPLSPNWWLAKDKGGVAVKLVTERNGIQLAEPAFEIARGRSITFDPDAGTVAHGDARSPWDDLAIPGDYIKAEARAGRMGSILYAVVVRVSGKRDFRIPTQTDLDAIGAAESELKRLLPEWEGSSVIPTESIPDGLKTSEPLRYGMDRWRHMFSPRQLLVHGTFAEEYQNLLTQLRHDCRDQAQDESERTSAVLALLALMSGTALNYNSLLTSWHVSRAAMRSVFERHDFAFKWTYAEFEGARELYLWALKQTVEAYERIAGLLLPSDSTNPQRVVLSNPVPGSINVTRGNAGALGEVDTASQMAVTVDPPYYDNVMYAELSDYFYVWEKRTLGRVWPEFFRDELTDKKNEAVANPARFKDAGRRRKELATADYEAKMTAIFEECHRVLREDGVLTVMFTHKKAEAWDTLGLALMDAGFTIGTSWPVPTEPETSLHQAKKNAAQSTILLVCRKRPTRDNATVFYEDIEADVRAAARDALERCRAFGIDGVDLLLSTYGPALSVISGNWPVYSSEADPVTGNNRLLRPEEALDTAREELVRLQRLRLIGRSANLDSLTDFALLAWETFKAREFPFDEARRLALAVGGLDVDTLARAKLLTKKSGTVVLLEPGQRLRRKGGAEAALPGVRLDATSFEHLVDAVHTALHITKQDGPATAKQFLERAGLTRDSRFLAAVQGFVNAIPRTRSRGEWVVPEAGLLDTLAVFLDGVVVPAPEEQREVLEQGGFAFDGDTEE